MYATDPNQVIWPSDVLESANIPGSARQFLATTGLPPLLADLSIEFGVFDSNSESLVIGTDGEAPIVVDQEGAVHLLIEDENPGRLFVNSSVPALSQFLHLIAAFKKGDAADAETIRRDLADLRGHLREIDPNAIDGDEAKVWPPLLDDLDAMAF
jgi:hypothetical protein